MDTEKCKIKLDSPENIYFSGQEIKGQITLNLSKRTKIRSISFTFIGYGKCNWCEFLRRESQIFSSTEKDMQRSMVYSSREEYVNHKSYIFGSKTSKPVELPPGSHTYDFTFGLKSDLPSTFKGSYGSIKYKMEFTVDKAWNFDDKFKIPIIVVKSMRQGATAQYIPAPITKQLTKNIGIFSGSPISLVAVLPNNSAIRGNMLKLCVTVDNKSNTHVEKLKFSVRQCITYYSQQPLPFVTREECIKVYKKETGSIEKKTQRSFEHELDMPFCQPTDDTCSRIIHIRYEVQIDAVLPGLHKNITITMPLIVCSHERDEPFQYQQQSNRAGIPNVGWVPLYPNLNTSMTSLTSSEQSTSPSHSINSSQSSHRSSDGSMSMSPLNISHSSAGHPGAEMFHSLPSSFGARSDLPAMTTPLSQSATECPRYPTDLAVSPRRCATPPTYPSAMGFYSSSTDTLFNQPPPEYNRNSIIIGDPSTSDQLTNNIQISYDIRTSTLRRSIHTSDIAPPSYDEIFGTSSRIPNVVPSAPPIEKA